MSIRRREFVAAVGGATVLPLAVPARQLQLPLVALINGGAASPSANFAAAFRKGLADEGYLEGRNATIEYHWLDGQFHLVPALVADLIRRRVAVIATPLSRKLRGVFGLSR